jgi:hypothetical protein
MVQPGAPAFRSDVIIFEPAKLGVFGEFPVAEYEIDAENAAAIIQYPVQSNGVGHVRSSGLNRVFHSRMLLDPTPALKRASV